MNQETSNSTRYTKKTVENPQIITQYSRKAAPVTTTVSGPSGQNRTKTSEIKRVSPNVSLKSRPQTKITNLKVQDPKTNTTGRAYGNVVKNITDSLKSKLDNNYQNKTQNDRYKSYSQSNRDDRKNVSNARTRRNERGNSENIFRSKSLERGGKYKNVRVTHIIFTSDPDCDINILEQLDIKYKDRASLYEELKKKNKFYRGKDFKCTYTDSCRDWKPKIKEKKSYNTVVYQHCKGKQTNYDINDKGQIENKSVKNYAPIRLTTDGNNAFKKDDNKNIRNNIVRMNYKPSPPPRGQNNQRSTDSQNKKK